MVTFGRLTDVGIASVGFSVSMFALVSCIEASTATEAEDALCLAKTCVCFGEITIVGLLGKADVQSEHHEGLETKLVTVDKVIEELESS